MNKKQILTKLKKIETHYKPLFNRIYYSKYTHKTGYSGQYNVDTRNIKIALVNDERDLIQTYFHELGHGYCIKNGLWKSYHKSTLNNTQEVDLYIRTALKAERWVDKWAEKEMKKHFPDLKYKPYYMEDRFVKWFRDNILNEMKEWNILLNNKNKL